jgi:hypothetical protein
MNAHTPGQGSFRVLAHRLRPRLKPQVLTLRVRGNPTSDVLPAPGVRNRGWRPRRDSLRRYEFSADFVGFAHGQWAGFRTSLCLRHQEPSGRARDSIHNGLSGLRQRTVRTRRHFNHRALLAAFLLVCLLEMTAGGLLWGADKIGAILTLVLLPLGAVFWWGFALPIPPIFALVRTVLIVLNWQHLS